MKKVLLYFFLFLFYFPLHGQEVDNTLTRHVVESRLVKQVAVFHQEKLYLHLDRTHYIPGEKLWFKAYLVNAYSNEYPVSSRYIYVELITPADSITARVMIRPEQGLYYGAIPLSDELAEGTYKLRAYTRYMENQGVESFFNKSIQIGNFIAEQINPDYDVSFFPEGGNLLDGVLCRIAFKALNANGYSEEISGYIVNETGDTLVNKVNSYHNGMGLIDFISKKEERYYLVCKNKKSVEKRFELPKALSGTYSLQTFWRKNELLVIRKNSSDVPTQAPLYLLIHQTGNLYYWSKWEENTVLTFSKDQLPQGVLQILLFDDKLNPLSERLVFSNKHDFASLSVTTDKSEYDIREKVVVNLQAKDDIGLSTAGHLSVAITDNRDVVVDSTTHIISTLLLSSELRGHIENPGYYFQPTPEAEIYLDLVMRIHGWRRYHIPAVLKGEYTYPRIPVEEAQSFTGEVQRLINSKPIKDSNVTLWISSPGSTGYYLNQTLTDEKGRFSFDQLELPDSLKVFVQSLNKGSSHVRLTLDSPEYPALLSTNKWLPYFRNQQKEEAIEAYTYKARQRTLDDNMQLVQLEDIEVVASKKVEKEDPYQSHYSSIFTKAWDQEAIERSSVSRLIDFFYQVPGVRVVDQKDEKYLIVRSSASLESSIPALILIDGMEVEPEYALTVLDISVVARIEVFKSSDAVVFGAKGAYGAVNIILKDAEKMVFQEKEKDNTKTITPLGYQRPVEFYSPKYETLEQRSNPKSDMRATLYWKPDLFIGEDGKAGFEFYTSDRRSTTYSVVIEGITDNGKLVHSVQRIAIK